MSGRNTPKGRQTPKVSFKQESDSDSEADRHTTRNGARPKTNNGPATIKPEKPRAAPMQNVSWFAPLVQTGKSDLKFANGDGVPVSQGVDNTYQHGYWLRTQRNFTKGGKSLTANPRWYFYYTGTGRYADLRFGTRQPDIVWVGRNGANVNRLGNMGTRNPNNDSAIPVQLPEGIPKGFYAEGTRSRNSSRSSSRGSSRNTSASNSRANSRASSPGRNLPPQAGSEPWMAYLVQKLQALESKVDGKKPEKTPQKVTKQGAANMADKLRHKRTPHKGSGVTQNFGRRGPGDLEGNFGDLEMLKLGTDDPRFPAAAQMAPTAAAFLFMSHFDTREENDATWLNYRGAIKLPKDNPNYATWMKLLKENVDAYKDFPQAPERETKKKKKDVVVEDVTVVEDVRDENGLTDDDWLGADDTTIYADENDKPKSQRRRKKREAAVVETPDV
uniref:Nucleocapsid phosphoprotein n=8 Tax=Orthocoronavirinae TaxID=2501931 RepID=A0AA49EHH7_9NIDO|nr:nucleocapsid phosphoprotein [Bat Coronavirus EsYN17]WCC63811.1 nucleocapsid phosphoprotein [Bat Coronavirus EsYN16]